MTVTPLTRRDHRSRPASDRRRPAVAAPGPGDPADALTVSFEVTLTGDTRYSEALGLLDALRQATTGLDHVSLDVTPRAAPSPGQLVGVPPAGSLTAVLDGVVSAMRDDADPLDAAGPPAERGAIRILADSRRVLLDGEPVELTRIEFDLLTFLAEHPHRVFTRAQLLAQVWGYAQTGERTVDVHIRRVRGKLGDRPIVTTIRSIGYRLDDRADIRVIRRH